jgi:hypothetical protein
LPWITQNKNIYLGLKISATGNFHKAVNDLRDQARRTFYTIKRNIKFDILIRNPLPFTVVRSGVRSPTNNSQNWTNTTLRLYMHNSAKVILCVHRKAPNNACTAELGQYP